MASTEILYQNSYFISNNLKIDPGEQKIGENVIFNNQLFNLPFSEIKTIRRDFGDENTRISNSSKETHKYKAIGTKLIIQQTETNTNQKIINTSTITLQDPSTLQSYALNL